MSLQAAPAIYEGGHVGRYGAGEEHFLAGGGVHEAQRAGMKSLARTRLEAVVDKLAIGG